jgi:hypothetical protein
LKNIAFVALVELAKDLLVIPFALGDRVVEDRRVGGEPGDGFRLDVAFERAAIEEIAGDVVQPKALAELVEVTGSGRGHGSGPLWFAHAWMKVDRHVACLWAGV